MESLTNASNMLWQHSGFQKTKSTDLEDGQSGVPYNELCAHCKQQSPAFGLKPQNYITVFLTIIAVSGASAIALGAYFGHIFANAQPWDERKKLYVVALLYHFIHTLALFGCLLSGKPRLSGTLISVGMLIFCGTIYFHVFTGIAALTIFTPVGGSMLLLGWLSMAL